MPTYEYRCDSCNHRFEAFQSIKDDPVSICPSCGEKTVSRLISPGGGLLFKGSGFYITDYRSKSYQQDAKKEKPAPTKSEAGKSSPSTGRSNGKSDTKSGD